MQRVAQRCFCSALSVSLDFFTDLNSRKNSMCERIQLTQTHNNMKEEQTLLCSDGGQEKVIY